MGEKLPQETPILVKRLRRAAKALRKSGAGDPVLSAYANTCDQAAGRLEDLCSLITQIQQPISN